MEEMCRVLLIHTRLTYTNRSCLWKKREGRKQRDNGRQGREQDGDDSCKTEIKKTKNKKTTDLR